MKSTIIKGSVWVGILMYCIACFPPQETTEPTALQPSPVYHKEAEWISDTNYEWGNQKVWSLGEVQLLDTVYEMRYVFRMIQMAISPRARRFWILDNGAATYCYEIRQLNRDIPYWRNDTL